MRNGEIFVIILHILLCEMKIVKRGNGGGNGGEFIITAFHLIIL